MDIEIIARKFYDYSIFMRGYSKGTIDRYRKIIDAYRVHMKITEIEQVTEINVRQMFMYGRIERKWCASTFIAYYMSLRVFFAWCRKEGYLKIDPLKDFELPKMEKRLPRRITKQDALKLLEIAYNYPYAWKFLRYRNQAIFAMFLFAGLRKNELLNLKYTDVDLENMTIFVRQGKGNKDRIVPMSYTLADILKKYLAERKRLNKTCPQFFASLNHNLGYTNNGLKRLVEQMRKASGIVFTIHKLRHTFATLMLEGGCDIYSLSKMMGHSDIKTTTIYLSASVELMRSQITKHPLNDL
jgi:site-specific recombinase XerD